jgi:hypothetical protein
MECKQLAHEAAVSAEMHAILPLREAQARSYGAAYSAPKVSAQEDSLMFWLGRVARQVREDSERMAVHIAAAVYVTESTISRFETGQTVPRKLDEIIAAYAAEADRAPAEIWGEALDAWNESRRSAAKAGSTDVKRILEEVALRSRQRRDSNQAESPARRARGPRP